MLLVAACLAALGAPVVLGPDGPLRLGPTTAARAPEILVDPRDGSLWLDDGRLRFEGGRWIEDGVDLQAPPPPEPGTTAPLDPLHVWDAAARLEAAIDASGSRRRFLYDRDGRLSGVLSSDGEVVQVRYATDGRVREIAGPGIQHWRFQWQADGLRATDTLGHAWTIATTGARTLVSDPLAREARTTIDAAGRIVAATDPVGGQLTLRWSDDVVELRTHAGRSFRVALGADRRPRSLDLPSGARWRWTYDDAGRLLSTTDPTGRRATWTRDAFGNVVGFELGRVALHFERDGEARLLAIADALGNAVRIVRDPAGALLAIEDAIGGRIVLNGGGRDVPLEITTRRKGAITFGFDVLGRLADALDPVGGRLTFGRDGAGQLTRIVDSVFGETRIDRALDGGISRVMGPDHRTLGLVRDGSGALAALLRPDGTSVAIERGPLSEVVAIREGEEVFRIARDGDLRPIEAGTLGFAWSADDLAERVDTGAVALRIARDASGRIRELAARAFSIAVERDATGLPVRWMGTDGVLEVTRDATGREIGETARGGDALTVTRDPRGWIDRVDLGKRSWRIDREPGGSVIRVQGPDDLRLGHDVDALGRVTLVRYPSGALGRYRYEGHAVLEAIDGADGKEIQARRYELDARGFRLSALDTGGLETLWRYDPLGEVVAIEGPDGAWSWTPDGYRGPEGEVLVSDRDGRAAEARPPSWPHAWSVAEEMLTVRRDPWGRMLELQGELGSVDLVYDPIGRLGAVRVPGGSAWRLDYDPRGRWTRVRTPDGSDTLLRWGAGGELLSSGARAWVGDELGLLAMVEDGAYAEIVRDRWGDPVALTMQGQPAVQHHASPTGYPSSEASGLAGPGQLLQLFPGGPLLGDSVAIDPVSGQRVDGWTGWPWSARSVRAPTTNEQLDPTPWLATCAWGDPIDLLVGLGVVRPPTDAPTVRVLSDGPVLVGMPNGLEGGRPPMGPSLDAIEIGLGPVADLLVAAMLRGEGEVAPDEMLALVLADDLALGWLPPGVDVPGLERWRVASERVRAIRGDP
jgi:YD repeat-containing protein